MKNYIKNELFEGIVSRKEFTLLAQDCIIDKDNSVLISIHDPDHKIHPKELTKGFRDVLQIKFWDVEESFGKYIPITESQGKEIYDFIKKNKDSKFLVNCEAGQSRSAGVGLAIECIVNFGGDIYSYKTGYSSIKEHKRYSPNLVVFDTIMKGV